MGTSVNKTEANKAAELELLNKLSAPKHRIQYTHHKKKTSVGAFSDFIQKDFDASLGERNRDSVLAAILIVCIMPLVFIPEVTLKVGCILTFLFGSFMLISASVGNTKIIATGQSISFPLIFLRQAAFRLKRKWTELKQVSFTTNNVPSKTPEQLTLRFDDGAEVHLNVDGFDKEGIESLVLLLGTYCADIEITPPLEELDLGIQSSSGDAISFTRLWETGLERRFGSTAFVPLEAGDQLQNRRVRIVGQMAFGGLSAIYLAKMGDEIIAVKEAVLPESADQVAREKALEMFQREAELLSRIKHPQVATVYDHLVENGRHYLLLEFKDGMNLRRYISEQGPQQEATVLRWALEAGKILKYLHGLDPPIIHRDFTPENLVLQKNGRLALVDFGAANSFIGTVTGTVVGKPSYIPPEQFKGKATLQSDIFALGCTLFFLLTGRDPEPFIPSSPRFQGIRISNKLDKLIRSATSPDLNSRITSIELFVEDLSRLQNGKDV